MGRKLDALLGRKFKTSKLKTTVNLAISRLSFLKNNRHARFTIARSDIIQLLRLNHHEQALIRVEQVIKDQNMLDVYDMIHGYCHLLIQKINLIEQAKDCPNEMVEAVSSLLYAAPRCGEFPELQEIRALLTSRVGKEFANGAIESRNNRGVSHTMIQKLSPGQSSLESRMKMLTGIAKENNIVLRLEKSSPETKKEKLVVEKKQSQVNPEVHPAAVAVGVSPEKFEKVLSFSESKKGRSMYRDVADAAQDAFESAAYAAVAARAAVVLSRSESLASDGPDSPNSRPRKVLDSESLKSKLQTSGFKSSATPGYDSESESESEYEKTRARSKYNMKAADLYGSGSGSGSDG